MGVHQHMGASQARLELLQVWVRHQAWVSRLILSRHIHFEAATDMHFQAAHPASQHQAQPLHLAQPTQTPPPDHGQQVSQQASRHPQTCRTSISAHP
jgi:hypothetical protein